METLGNNLEIKMSKSSKSIFICELCDYKCCRKFNIDRHLLSSRHIKEINRKEKGAQNEQNEQTSEFTCDKCNKIFVILNIKMRRMNYQIRN
jgi:5-methylcytosine-specific restriction endonuclease McrA